MRNLEKVNRKLLDGSVWDQSSSSMSLPQQNGTTSPALTWTVLLQVTQ